MGEIQSMSGSNLYLANEAVPGVAETSGYFGVPGIRMRPGFDGERDTFRGGGGKVVTATLGTDEVSPWETDIASCFNHVGLVLASRFGIPTTTTPGGGTNSRQHVGYINPKAEDLARFLSAIWGDGYVTAQGVYGYFNNLTMDISRGEVNIDSDFRSRAAQLAGGSILPGNEKQTITITGSPTGGTWILTLPFLIGGSGSTSTINHNATAADVKTRIVNIPGNKIGADEVTVTGGPGPAAPFVVTFHGRYAQTNLAAMTATPSFTGGSSPNVTITETQAGGAVTDMKLAPMPSNMWDMFIDSSWATLGNTQYGGAYNLKLQFGDKYDEDAPINSSIISYERAIEKAEQEDTLETTIRLGATALAQAANIQSGTPQFIRAKLSTANGPNPYYIESTIPYSLQFDMCVGLTKRGTIDTAPNSSARVLPLSGVMQLDSTSGNYVRYTLVNTVLGY